MFVSEQFVYLELHKTGCTHIRKILNTVLDGELIGSHNRAPESLFDGRIFLGSVRNPWSWYVSLWAFGCRGKGELYHRLINANADFWEVRYSDLNSANCFQDWLCGVMDYKMASHSEEYYGDFPLAMFTGLMSFRYIFLYCLKRTDPIQQLESLLVYPQLKAYEREHNFVHHFIRNERLEFDIFDILEHYEISLPEITRTEVMSLEKSNQTKRLYDASFYYDSHTEQLVAEKERLIVEKFGYAGPGQQSFTASPNLQVSL